MTKQSKIGIASPDKSRDRNDKPLSAIKYHGMISAKTGQALHP